MSVSETLRQAIRKSGHSVHAIAGASGVPQPRLHHFLKGKDLTGKNIDKLATYLGLELRPRGRKLRQAKLEE